MWVCPTYVTLPLQIIYSNVVEVIKSFFPPANPSWVSLKKIWFMFCLFRILRCANTIEYCPRWVTFAQRIYILSVVTMARHTTTPACSVMKTCKYTSQTMVSFRVDVPDYPLTHNSVPIAVWGALQPVY